MGRTKGAKNIHSSKDKILTNAFILFAAKQYEQVTFDDIEKATGVTRGSIIYHFANKENIFTEVIKFYVLNKMSVSKMFSVNICLKDFISQYVNNCIKEKEIYNKMGVKNVNLALFNIENSAFMFSPEMKELSANWYKMEIDTWKSLLKNAIAKKEIKQKINIDVVSRLFMHTYLGLSYSGIVTIKGVDYNMLKEEFDYIYSSIINN